MRAVCRNAHLGEALGSVSRLPAGGISKPGALGYVVATHASRSRRLFPCTMMIACAMNDCEHPLRQSGKTPGSIGGPLGTFVQHNFEFKLTIGAAIVRPRSQA